MPEVESYPELDRDVLMLYLSLWEGGAVRPPAVGTPKPERLTWQSDEWWESKVAVWSDGRYTRTQRKRAVDDAAMVAAESARQAKLKSRP